MDRAGLLAALAHPNVAAFLRVIRKGESSQDDGAYTIQYGGKNFAAPPWEHPREKVTAGKWTSTAAGAYQFLAGTWDVVVAGYGFEDFSPANQDLGAVALIAGRKALDDVIAGRFESAIAKCAKEWASLPGSPYGQPVMTMAEARDIYQKWGGTFGAQPPKAPPVTPEATPAPAKAPRPKGPTMPLPILALISTFGPMLADLIPQVAKLFSSGSDVATRNVAAATAVFDTVVKASGEPNIQSAIEAMQGDDATRSRVTEAVVTDPVIIQLLEVGGGIVKAREAAADPGQIVFYKNPAFLMATALLPLLYMVAVELLFNPSGQVWSDDIKMMFVTAIISGLLGSITGFFLGSSLGSQRKTELKGTP